MTDLIERKLHRLAGKLSGRLSRPGQQLYAAATAIWAKPVGRMPSVVAHCQTPEDVRAAIQTARDCELPLSVRAGGHDWAGRALCEGLVIDLSGMNSAVVDSVKRTAQVAGGARASDVLAVADPLGLAAVTGSCSSVGMAGLTLGGGYGSLIGRFGLALDNLLAAEVVLADGRIVSARQDSEAELFWALRGGGGNFGVVTAMQCRLHDVPNVRSGMLLFPFGEAKAVLEGCVSITANAPEELTVQLGLAGGPDGTPLAMVVPTWCGPPEAGEARLEPFSKLGTVVAGAMDAMSYGDSLAAFDPFLVIGQRVFMESCWLPALDGRSIDAFIEAIANAVSPGCAIFTHECRGAASRVPVEATAFGLRRDHVLVEILATYADRSNPVDEDQHRRWVQDTLDAFSTMALPGGYPNFLPSGDVERAMKSYGCNVDRLIKAKRHYDPDNVFGSAIPLPASMRTLAAE
ncbi:FAD-binding oxidoreductase [Bradyrhizobium sp. URHD0069]|uniref:FAD-binding oxidoreductase n=1 Tax=Bradyrhizobium sp. URHD0069 TaxID=1380355 RepID=UPI0004966D41|nr:FAD-binding oxidoreductase [Bradyrhizobium sp. URHD0069]